MKQKYLIRFNTQHGDSGLTWKVIGPEKMYLVAGVNIQVPSHDETSMEGQTLKYNIACEGVLQIENQIAIIS